MVIISVHLRHVIAHSFQLHGGSKQVELVQAGDIAVEGLLRAQQKLMQVVSQLLLKILHYFIFICKGSHFPIIIRIFVPKFNNS